MRIRLELKLNLHDLWVGVYWVKDDQFEVHWFPVINIYICLIPALPLHIEISLGHKGDYLP